MTVVHLGKGNLGSHAHAHFLGVLFGGALGAHMRSVNPGVENWLVSICTHLEQAFISCIMALPTCKEGLHHLVGMSKQTQKEHLQCFCVADSRSHAKLPPGCSKAKYRE